MSALGALLAVIDKEALAPSWQGLQDADVAGEGDAAGAVHGAYGGGGPEGTLVVERLSQLNVQG